MATGVWRTFLRLSVRLGKWRSFVRTLWDNDFVTICLWPLESRCAQQWSVSFFLNHRSGNLFRDTLFHFGTLYWMYQVVMWCHWCSWRENKISWIASNCRNLPSIFKTNSLWKKFKEYHRWSEIMFDFSPEIDWSTVPDSRIIIVLFVNPSPLSRNSCDLLWCQSALCWRSEELFTEELIPNGELLEFKIVKYILNLEMISIQHTPHWFVATPTCWSGMLWWYLILCNLELSV